MKHKVIKAEMMGLWKAAAAAYLAVFIFIPERSGEIGACACTGLGQFIWNLVPVFLCVGLMDVWIESDKMIKMMGDRSGLSGMGISLLLGMLTAVPVYALLPIAWTFLIRQLSFNIKSHGIVINMQKPFGIFPVKGRYETDSLLL